MSDLTATFQNMQQDIAQTNQAGLDFQTAVTEQNMAFSAESAALDMIASIAEKISSTVQAQARNIAN